MSKINTIIIDDELFNRELIQDFVLRLNPSYSVIGTSDNATDGYELINNLKPDLVFLDVKMPGGSGFELLEKFEYCDFEVIFITGFDEFAIKAFEFNALDYVLKPIDQTKFKFTLDKVKARFDDKMSNIHNLKSIIQTVDPKDVIITKIPIHYQNKVILVDVKDLVCLQSDGTCTSFCTTNSETYTSSRKMIDFEFIMNKLSNFIKINRGIYINLNFIQSYTKGDVCFITLINNEVFEVSRRKKGEILAALNRKTH